MFTIGNVELIPFRDARFRSEKNKYALARGRTVKDPLTLTTEEIETLKVLSNRSNLLNYALILYQKLHIKDVLYNGINTGIFHTKIFFVVPLEKEARQWLESYGFAISPKPNTVWITGRDGWQYEAPNSPPPSDTEFMLLW